MSYEIIGLQINVSALRSHENISHW